MSDYKTALLLDTLDRGTIQTALQTNNYYRILKYPNSSVKNWESIFDILESEEDNENFIVLGKLTEHTLFRMCLPEYEDVVNRIIKKISEKKHLIFIYKDNLMGEFSFFKNVEIKQSVYEIDERKDYFNYPENEITAWIDFHNVKCSEEEYLKKVQKLILRLNQELKTLPYEKLIDIEISGQNFIENVADGLLFRIYIPNERIWSNEFDKFITLFRDYASTISKEELKITQNRTDVGVICSLYSVNKDISEEEISSLYKEFSSFMDLCSNNPSEAEKIIDKTDLREPEKRNILRKYIRESKRLLLDISQERESKLLTIKHSLQNELQESDLSKEILDYVDQSIPASNFSDKIAFGTQNVQNQTININPQIISQVEGVVCNELNGNVHFNAQEKELSKLIEKFSENISEASELQSSLYELIDKATPKEKKRSSWQKLYGFLSKIAPKVGETGLNILLHFIEQKMKGE